jgi:CBS domain-containing protein/sporulation protein YlmC with PRC-barrel domain
MNVSDSTINGPVYYLTDILGARVSCHGKKIGRLADLVIVENDPIPEVTKLYIRRPFGHPSLLIPWEKIKVLKEEEIVVSIDSLVAFESEPQPHDILLKDHILDKKVLDIEDREVEVVYDVKLIVKHNKLLVSDVNISRYRFLRRLGLKWFANFLYGLRGKGKDQKIPWRFIQPLPQDIGSFHGDVKLKVLKETLGEIHPADLADIIEELDSSQRVAIFSELESGRASDTLEEIDPTVQRDLVSAMKKERVAQLLNTMTPGQAADILSVLPLSDTKAIIHVLRTLNLENASKIESILGKQEERIRNFTTTKVMKLRQETPAEEAREYFNRMAKYMDIIMYVYIVDEQERLVGVMDLKELLQAKTNQTLKDVMTDNVISLSPKSTLKEALEYFSRYEFRALPVIDEHHKLVGAIPFRDVMNLKHRFLE